MPPTFIKPGYSKPTPVQPAEPYQYSEYPKWVPSIIEHKKVIVPNAEEEARHTGKPVEEVVRETVVHVPEPPAPYIPEAYPKWVHSKLLGKRLVVSNSVEEEHHTGVPMNEDGTPAVAESEKPMPPTLEIVMAAGYPKEAAEKIVEEEDGKARRGEKPYGDKEPEEPKIQTGISLGDPAYDAAKTSKNKSRAKAQGGYVAAGVAKTATVGEDEGWDK
jgi:hypothetical protein